MKINGENTVPVSCNRDCGAGCPLLAHIRGGRIKKITDNPLKDGLMKGCIRGYRMPATLYSDKRIRTPLLRYGDRGAGRFREISWEEALCRISEKLDEIRNRNSSFSVFPFDGSGSCRGAVHNTGLLTKRFFSLFGGFIERSDSYSNAASAFSTMVVFGTRMVGFDSPTLQNSKLIILWGANLCETRFGCQIESWIRKRKKNGIPIIVIDPRRSLTVKNLSTQWIPINPGTDSAMMAAVLYVLLREGYVDQDFAGKYSVGFDELSAYIMGQNDGLPKDPRWAQGICNVKAETIIDFARTYGKSKPAALLPGLSIQRTLGGEETYRFAPALQTATGNVGQPGGSSGGEFWGKLPIPYFPKMTVPNSASFPKTPIYQWPDAVLKGKAGGYHADIKAIYNVGSNLLNQGSDIKKNIKAFQKVDFVVSHDLFMTPTALFSDIILPATTFLEREDVVFPADNYLFYSAKASNTLHKARNDYDIFWELSDRLGYGEAFSGNRTSEEWLNKFIEASEVEDIDLFKSTGIFKGKNQMRVGLAEYIRDPGKNPLKTPSGKIEIRSEAFAKTGFSATPECRITQPGTSYPLRLITPHSRYKVNSQNSNMSWAERLLPPSIEMNRLDGKERNIRTGNFVRVISKEGEMKIKVKLTENIIRGVVCLYQGFWSTRDEKGTETGGSANILTSTISTQPSKGSRTHSVFVKIEKV